jgi:hypothetical protein
LDIYLNLQQLSLRRGFKQYFKKSGFIDVEGCRNFGVATIQSVKKNNIEGDSHEYEKNNCSNFYLCQRYKQMHSRRIFSKDPIINLENFQKKKSTLGFLRINSFDFKIDYKTVGPDIQTKKNNIFCNVGC